MGLGVAYFFARRLDEAEAMLLRSLQGYPNGRRPIAFSPRPTPIAASSTRPAGRSKRCGR